MMQKMKETRITANLDRKMETPQSAVKFVYIN